MKLIAGLGNPGAAYCQTRHNIGFMAVDRIAAEAGIALQEMNFEALIGRGRWCGLDIMLAKPQTFMNRSGAAVEAIAHAFALHSDDIVIIHDDMDLPFGSVRIKTRGGSGGHRGIASIKECLSTDLFVRLRLGIGRPPETLAGSDYVLDKFPDTEREELVSVTGMVVQCLEMLLTQGIPAAMNRFHAMAVRVEENGTNPCKD